MATNLSTHAMRDALRIRKYLHNQQCGTSDPKTLRSNVRRAMAYCVCLLGLWVFGSSRES